MTRLQTGDDPGATFLAELRQGFARASAQNVAVRDFQIGGIPVRFELAGLGLEPLLTGALSHLASIGPPSLVLKAWDGASTGVVIDPPSLSPEGYGPLGEILQLQGGSRFVVFSSGVLSAFDRDTGHGYCWIADVVGRPSWEYAAPMCSLLGAMLRSRNRHIIHGAAVGWNGVSALIGGYGGAGKSSTAVACFADGMSYLGDDYCILSEDPEPRLHSLYSSAKLHPGEAQGGDLRSFPTVAASALDAKQVFHLATEPGPRFPSSLPLKAIFLPRICEGERSSVRSISPMQAILPILASTAAQSPGVGRELLRSLSSVARQVPSFELRLGSSRPSVAKTVRETLNHLA